jgi:F-type H+-transporting ATPase subunit b
MLIDWFTVIAQALNFLILVWLLKRFLYKPVLNAIAVREKRIAAELADADTSKAAALKDREELQNKSSVFDQQRKGLFSKAEEDAKAKSSELMAQARQDADHLRTQQGVSLKDDYLKLSQAITRLTANEVFAIARKALSDMATVSLEERMAEVFTRRLRELPGKARASLSLALATSSEPAVLNSTFDLPDNQKAAIQNALNETFSAEVRVRFQTAPHDICGIELITNGQKVSWSIDQYLTSLNGKVSAVLDAQQLPAPAMAAAAVAGAK